MAGLCRPEPGSGLAAGHPKGVALTPARTARSCWIGMPVYSKAIGEASRWIDEYNTPGAYLTRHSSVIGASNGLLRQYFPKGTDLSRWSSQDLEAVALAINNRPRKILGWKSPAEVFEEQLRSLQQPGVASTG